MKKLDSEKQQKSKQPKPEKENKNKQPKGQEKSSLTKKYPSKTTINLAMRDTSKTDYKKRVPMFLLIGLLVIVFAKLGVSDMLTKMLDREGEAIGAEQLLQTTQLLLLDYDKVEEEYQNYNLEKMTMGTSLVSTMESLELAERYLLPAAKVSNFAVQGDVITVTLSSVNLDSISTIYNELKSDEKIRDVRVYTAATSAEDKEITICNMTIFLLSKESQEAGGGQ